MLEKHKEITSTICDYFDKKRSLSKPEQVSEAKMKLTDEIQEQFNAIQKNYESRKVCTLGIKNAYCVLPLFYEMCQQKRKGVLNVTGKMGHNYSKKIGLVYLYCTLDFDK